MTTRSAATTTVYVAELGCVALIERRGGPVTTSAKAAANRRLPVVAPLFGRPNQLIPGSVQAKLHKMVGLARPSEVLRDRRTPGRGLR